jgi:indole-3-glycerol phosphate synthase
MTILEEIIAHKIKEVAAAKKKPLEGLAIYEKRTPLSLRKAFDAKRMIGLIAEFKRHSPSKGTINSTSSVKEVTQGYVGSMATALSVLTDHDFFGGSLQDLMIAREANPLTPILRKDFIVDPFQISEAKRCGADVILLIAECLTETQVADYAKFAKDLGLSVLLEIHKEEQLEKYTKHIDAIGINNRDLKTFKVSVEQSIKLFSKLPKEALAISESGISDPKTAVSLYETGFHGLLIGEQFMKSKNPAESCDEFVSEVMRFQYTKQLKTTQLRNPLKWE